MPDGTLAIPSLNFSCPSAEPADREQVLTVVAADVRERPLTSDGRRLWSIALWLHLISIGTVAGATVAAFFGVAFVLLLQEAHGSRSRDHIAAVVQSAVLSAPRQDRAQPAPSKPRLAAVTAAVVQIPQAIAAPAKSDAYQRSLPEHAAEQAVAGGDLEANDAARPQPQAPGMRMSDRPAVKPVAVAAPANSAAAPPTPTSTAARAEPPLPKAEVAALLARGDAFLRAGDVASARLFYERAADAGDEQAAMRIGATFDPAFLASVGLRGTLGDPAKAREWYAHAGQPEPGKELR